MSVLEQMSALLPDTAGVSEKGHLTIGGCDVVGLAAEFGTPLYIFDEATLRALFTVAGDEVIDMDDLSRPPVVESSGEEEAP